MIRKTTLIALAITLCCALSAQESKPGRKYVAPLERGVRENIAQWQDYKFGMFIHWGVYSELGVIESWSLNPQPVSWMYRARKERGLSYNEYVELYQNLYRVFNPVSFDPSKWADAAKYAGMKYVVFTTKHHDGFCMFDTQQTDYKITSKDCPFHVNKNANIAKAVFEAFREKGINPGAYFSIADWHHQDYWWDFFPAKDRYPNYPVADFPEKWESFQDFANKQVDELTGGDYGELSMLWFDLSICSPDGSVVMDWDRLTKTARDNQPNIMLVARGIGGLRENYFTPEQEIPETALNYPWESCITMTYSWSYRPGLEYKSAKQMLDMLVQVVSRGGNLLLNVGPKPDGTLEETAYERLREIGDWMQVNSEGIYGTKVFSTNQDGKVCFTQKDGYVYAFYLAGEDETGMPAEISFKGVKPASKGAVSLLGAKGTLKWADNADGGITVSVPASVRRNKPCDHIWCLKIKI